MLVVVPSMYRGLLWQQLTHSSLTHILKEREKDKAVRFHCKGEEQLAQFCSSAPTGATESLPVSFIAPPHICERYTRRYTWKSDCRSKIDVENQLILGNFQQGLPQPKKQWGCSSQSLPSPTLCHQVHF